MCLWASLPTGDTMEGRVPGVEAQLYRTAFVHATMPLMVFDLDTGYCVEANRAAGQAYGYRANEWNGVSLFDIYDTQWRPALEVALHGLAAAQPGPPDIVRHRRRDGSVLWAAATLTPLGEGQHRQVMLCAQDVTLQQEALVELAVIRDHCTLAQELSGTGHCVLELKRGRQTWSRQQCLNFGLEASSIPDDLAGAIAVLIGCVHEHDRERAAAAVHACIDGGVPFDEEWRMRWPDGSEHILRVQASRKSETDGSPYAFVCASFDLTDTRRTEEKLRVTRADLSLAQRIARIGTWIVDLTTNTAITTSEEMHKVFGFSESEVPLALLTSRIHPDDRPVVEAARSCCIAHPGTGYHVQFRVLPRPGELYYVESQAEVQTDASGKAVRMVGYTRDITEAKLAEQEIQRLAYHDEVTGLPNRVALRRHLERATSVDAQDFAPLALMLIDVSRFQDICLTLGHNNADVLLKDVAVRIAGAIGKSAYVARTGGSQFAAVLSDEHVYESRPCARTVLRAFEAPFQVAGIQYDISVHIGIALCPGHASDPVDLIRKADVALFRARQIGTDVLVYASEDDPYSSDRLALLGEFRKAIQEGQIELYCQPKVEMRTNEVIGAEALVRWRHPRLGMISPALFVPLVEETELIHVLTRHMLQASVRQYFNWQREGMYVPLAVNVSPRNLLSNDLVPNLETLLHTWGGNPDWLGLEITESSLITDPDASIAKIAALSRMGFRLFVDDFGTGYSSLGYLTRMPVDVIKVDHGFTMRMLEDKRAAAIVKSTIELAHNLGMSVVAEGTSCKEIWDALTEYGCDEAQGYYVAEPFPADELGAWLKATGRRVRAHAVDVRTAR
jgi:diguanylate cyclase (GGDEF)-like protein/PAS domain S-box-containing protein